jgi:hypothetical protein
MIQHKAASRGTTSHRQLPAMAVHQGPHMPLQAPPTQGTGNNHHPTAMARCKLITLVLQLSHHPAAAGAVTMACTRAGPRLCVLHHRSSTARAPKWGYFAATARQRAPRAVVSLLLAWCRRHQLRRSTHVRSSALLWAPPTQGRQQGRLLHTHPTRQRCRGWLNKGAVWAHLGQCPDPPTVHWCPRRITQLRGRG